MWQVPETRPSILLRVQDPSDQDAWRIFESIYHPAIYRAARKRGLQDADADDVAQVVLAKLSSRPDQFCLDKSRGRFRTWLTRVTENAVIDLLRKQKREASVENGVEHVISDRRSFRDQLEHEYRREVFAWASRVIRSEFTDDVWRSFWMTAVEGHSVSDVAEELKRSVGAVYTSRSRIMQRLKQQVGQFDAEMDKEL